MWQTVDRVRANRVVFNCTMARIQQVVARRCWVIDVLWLSVLAIYVLAGTSQAPFHGDESTIIWMSKDFAYIFTEGELDRVRYHDPPVNATEQHLRLLNGSLVKYLIGVSLWLNNYSIDAINEQWHWGFDWDWNVQNGHIPDDTLLMLGRWPSALMLAGSVIVLFMIGSSLGGRWTAYPSTLYYAMNPAVLVNGRRAMFEGGLLLFTLLILLAGLSVNRRRDWRYALVLGIVIGLGLSTKHTAVLPVFGIILGLSWQAVSRFHRGERAAARGLWLRIGAALVLGIVVFLIMNPVWWGDLVTRAKQVLDERSGLLDGQVVAYGGYSRPIDQVKGFLRQTFDTSPQYFEITDWAVFIGDQIHRYEATAWDGVSIGGSLLTIAFVSILASCGICRLMRRSIEGQPRDQIVLTWILIIFAWNLLLTPLEWQRYYLMGYPAMALLVGYGIRAGFEHFVRRKQDRATSLS